MKSGIELIATERQRQIDQEGWTPEHDDQHRDEELRRAAICYLDRGLFAAYWPWSPQWWKPTNKVRDLIKAGALIAAEIDRLQRLLKESDRD